MLICAIGMLIERDHENQTGEGEHYYHLARAALCLEPVLEEPSMVTTLFVIQIGLHRDSARWGLKETDIQRRRVLFWDIFIGDNGRVLPGRHLAQNTSAFLSRSLQSNDTHLRVQCSRIPIFCSCLCMCLLSQHS
ncbi:hypothetical protein BC835DRAFT_1368003 [Cytidiella melzeri]|nr:hypothetical protein BC835DRAFT_1368003 [Cytidiella melzeri]